RRHAGSRARRGAGRRGHYDCRRKRRPPPPARRKERSARDSSPPARRRSAQARRRPGHLRLSARAVAVRLPVADTPRSQGLPRFATGLTAHKKAALGGKLAFQPADQGSLPMPAMKIAMSVLACAVALLAGCGGADQYATFVPKVL